MNAIAIPKLSRYNESISLMIITEQEIIASYQRMLNRLFSTYLLVLKKLTDLPLSIGLEGPQKSIRHEDTLYVQFY